jgi:23S rRNA pseudouridine1911/1915/1917 synthase
MSDSPFSAAGTSTATSIEVHHGNAGQRLDRFLALRHPDLSRTQIQKHIQDRNITIRGRAQISPSYKVRSGEIVDILIPAPRSLSLEPCSIPLSIIYEDEYILVLDKPSGLVVHPGAGNKEGTLVHALLHHCRDLSGIGGYLRPGIVHRLDKDTTGLMVVAKDDSSHRALVEQFKTGLVGKKYLALVRGRLRDKGGRLDQPIGRHAVQRKKMSTRSRGAKPALTEWEVLEDFNVASLLLLEIHTGRTHQIRVHMSSLGHPVLGDILYGGPARVVSGKTSISVPRQMLHSARLEIVHPATREKMAWDACIPGDMESVLEKLRGLSR